MDNSFSYSTDAPGLTKNFHPYRFESPPRSHRPRPECEYARYSDSEPSQHAQNAPNMNTPRFPKSIFAPAHYGMDYQLMPKYLKDLKHTRINSYTTSRNGMREGYYMSVFGRQAKTTLNFPYVLQVYTPKPFEETFQTKESALTRTPKMGDWQIINVFTGQHVYAPYRRNTHSFMCQ